MRGGGGDDDGGVPDREPADPVHRGEAFEATRALIDRLKETVPIWKHQMFEDGSDEWVGTP